MKPVVEHTYSEAKQQHEQVKDSICRSISNLVCNKNIQQLSNRDNNPSLQKGKVIPNATSNKIS